MNDQQQEQPKRRFTKKHILLIIGGMLFVYFILPLPFTTEAGRLDTQEQTIRWMYHNVINSKSPVHVCYIGVGSTFPLDKPAEIDDPPQELIDRFSDFRCPVLPASKTIKKRSGPDNIGEYVSDEKGNKGIALAAGNVTGLTLAMVKCRGYWFQADLAAGEVEVYFLRLPGLYIPIWKKYIWYS